MIDNTIFNLEKSYTHGEGSLFLRGAPGLLDSINKNYPEIWALYKKLKKLDWDENEFDLSSCNLEFKTCSKTVSDMMINTLAWQWEADSVAAHSISPIVAAFNPADELWALWSEISKNEILHALSYSEIVRNSFDDPQAVMADVLSKVEAHRRMKTVASALGYVKKVSAQITLGIVKEDSDEAIDAIMMFVCTMLVLERVQFMSSFAITFAVADSGLFLPIGKTVQKICTDEYSVHVPADKAILRNEMKVPRSIASMKRIRPFVTQMLSEVAASELVWTDIMFSDDKQLPGVTGEMVKDWVLYGVYDAASFLGVDNHFKHVMKNPLSYMDDWIDINKNQTSPQEEKAGNYLIGGLKKTSGDTVYDMDF